MIISQSLNALIECLTVLLEYINLFANYVEGHSMNLEGSGPCQVPFGYTTVVSRVSNVSAIAVSYLMLVHSLKFCNFLFKIVAYYFENYPCIFDARLML